MVFVFANESSTSISFVFLVGKSMSRHRVNVYLCTSTYKMFITKLVIKPKFTKQVFTIIFLSVFAVHLPLLWLSFHIQFLEILTPYFIFSFWLKHQEKVGITYAIIQTCCDMGSYSVLKIRLYSHNTTEPITLFLFKFDTDNSSHTVVVFSTRLSFYINAFYLLRGELHQFYIAAQLPIINIDNRIFLTKNLYSSKSRFVHPR